MDKLGAKAAVRRHVECWNRMDKESWLKLFAEDVSHEDPVGTGEGRGRQVLADAWEKSFTPTKRWIFEPVALFECGNECQVYLRNHGSLAGVPVCLEAIEHWRVNSEGLVDQVRAFWELPTDPDVLKHLAAASGGH